MSGRPMKLHSSCQNVKPGIRPRGARQRTGRPRRRMPPPSVALRPPPRDRARPEREWTGRPGLTSPLSPSPVRLAGKLPEQSIDRHQERLRHVGRQGVADRDPSDRRLPAPASRSSAGRAARRRAIDPGSTRRTSPIERRPARAPRPATGRRAAPRPAQGRRWPAARGARGPAPVAPVARHPPVASWSAASGGRRSSSGRRLRSEPLTRNRNE